MEKIGANIFVETVYPGVNVGCILTGDGAICVDTPLLPGEAQRWRARIRSLGAETVRFVVYTNGQQERILGTQYFVFDEEAPPAPEPSPVREVSRTHQLLFPRSAAPVTPDRRRNVQKGAVVAHSLAWDLVKEHCTDNFKQSMVDAFADRDPDMEDLEVILPQITFDEQLKLYAGSVTARLLAAAKGLAWVWLPERQVVFAGDTVVVGTHPPLEIADVRDWMAALERLRQEPQFQEAVVVPGRGPLCDISATEPVMEYLNVALEGTREVYQAGRPKAELNVLAAELLPFFPVADGQRERVQRQIKLGLDEMYDGFKARDANLA